MTSTTTAGEKAGSTTLIADALDALDLSGCDTHRAIERALEPLAEAVFITAAAGALIATEPMVQRLKLVGKCEEWARGIVERAAEAGGAKKAVLDDVGNRDERAVSAAAGRLAFEKWEFEHPDDLQAEGVSFALGTVAKHIARRADVVLGYPLTPAEAAWATVEGAKRAGVSLNRHAYACALDAAYRGEAERLDELARGWNFAGVLA